MITWHFRDLNIAAFFRPLFFLEIPILRLRRKSFYLYHLKKGELKSGK
jgi:hypothetical protein